MNAAPLDLQSAVPARGTSAAPARGPPAAALVTDAATLARRSELTGQLQHYLGRLAELDKLDPHDFTGLKQVYREHVRRTQDFLERLER